MQATPIPTPPPPVAPFGYPQGGRPNGHGFWVYDVQGQPISVGCNPSALCQIVLPAGEKISAKAIQDATSWDVPDTAYGPDGRSLLIVKVRSVDPLQGNDIRTQLVVITDRAQWPYTINLYASSRAPSDGTRIELEHPQAAVHEARRVVVRSTPAPTLPPVVQPCSKRESTRYGFRGEVRFMPREVFADGSGHTCVVMPAHIQEAPVVFRADSDGDEMVNYRYRDDGMLIVDGTPDVLVLQDGSGKGSQRLYIDRK